MTQYMHPEPAPFFLEGGRSGVLLIHGFTGSPPEMRLVGDYLHARGLTISAPLLPGHGTSVADMNRYKWTDWVDQVDLAFRELRERCDRVFVGGLSLGSVLALHLAADHADLAGAILYSPALWLAERKIYLSPVLKHIVTVRPKTGKTDLVDPEARLRLWSYDADPVAAAHELLKLITRVRGLLPRITCPLLIIHSTGDRSIHARSAMRTYARAGSTDRELVTIEASGHCITVDKEWAFVAARTYEWIERG